MKPHPKIIIHNYLPSKRTHDTPKATVTITGSGGKWLITNKATGQTKTAKSAEQAESIAAGWGMYEYK